MSVYCCVCVVYIIKLFLSWTGHDCFTQNWELIDLHDFFHTSRIEPTVNNTYDIEMSSLYVIFCFLISLTLTQYNNHVSIGLKWPTSPRPRGHLLLLLIQNMCS